MKGSNDFRASIYFRLSVNADFPEIKKFMHVPSISLIVYAVPTIFATPKMKMRQAAREGRKKNLHILWPFAVRGE